MDIYTKTQIKTNVVTALIVIAMIGMAIWTYMTMRGPHDNAQPEPTNNTTIEMQETVVFPDGDLPFADGLRMANHVTEYELDEFDSGTASEEVFNRDINGDGRTDRITRTRVENGTSHFYYDYKIELNQNGQMVDITPDGMRTTEGAECALQKIRFVFKPDFQIIKISRPWSESWTTPTLATKTVYGLVNNELRVASTTPLKTVCNVEDLF